MKKEEEEEEEAAEEKQEDKRVLKALRRCQQVEGQANNAAGEVRAALQIVNKWFTLTRLLQTV